MDNSRTVKLNKLLDAILHGQQTLSRQNVAHFLEAICLQPEPVTCIHNIITSETGLASLQSAMLMDHSTVFMNGLATQLLTYLQAPELTDVREGQFLHQILLKIVEPSVFWMEFIKAFRAGQLQEGGKQGFAWLLLQLISLPGDTAAPYRELAQDTTLVDAVLASSNADTRSIGHKIKHIIDVCGLHGAVDNAYGPGGRHDNDFVDFHAIAVLPTPDEITSKEPPFLRTSTALEGAAASESIAVHHDSQFRLLREDMLYEMREELQIALGRKKGYHRGLVIDGLKLLNHVHNGTSDRKCKWGIALQCKQDLWFFRRDKPKNRKQYLINDRKIVKHQSLACLIIDGDVVAFPTINRDEEYLARYPPVFILQLEGKGSTIRALTQLSQAKSIKLIQINTAVFSYEPILKALQDTMNMPLSRELLFWDGKGMMERPPNSPTQIIDALQTNPSQDLRTLLQTARSIVLDKAQAASLISGLTQRVSLIQGPPGTGKSFIGALLAKILHDSTQQTILVCCYTNHALDQFLEDLLDIGIPQYSIVRLGGKTTPRTEPLTLYNQQRTSKLGRADWQIINGLKAMSASTFDRLQSAFQNYKSSTVSDKAIMAHLKLKDPEYFEAFRIPQSDIPTGMQQVGKKGRAVDKYYLLNQWTHGKDAGTFKNNPHVLTAPKIWGMLPASRRDRLSTWKTTIIKGKVGELYDIAKQYNEYQTQLERKFANSDTATLRSKRIIGCTTTAAAKYSEDLRAASPNVLLVEEAGEILESHVLTALGAETRQLILIGDHKQLRPKVNNYLLTVEKGEGYDLNVSLFERLVLKGYPHETLNKQHRMRPEIAALIRHLTYPDLVDAEGTKNRPDLRGVRDNIVFINHDHPEDEIPKLADLRDGGSQTSKQNSHEVAMVLKITRYLAQQGYGAEKVVILTPYLGQLLQLRNALQKDNDPILNDMDSHDLVRAGLLPASTAQASKRPIRLATIDNYQGEESDIVVASLTRSNEAHDIGFMFAPERLNVLLSRARNALIMIGNADTFTNARKGKQLWTRFFDLLRKDGHIYDGFPIKCERHQDRTALLKQPADFDEECPDGGCKEPCGVMLNCGLHACPSKCHQLDDHSNMACEYILKSKCPNGHPQSWKYHETPPATCVKCEREARLAKEKQKKDFELQRQRDVKQQEHARQLAKLEEEIPAEL